MVKSLVLGVLFFTVNTGHPLFLAQTPEGHQACPNDQSNIDKLGTKTAADARSLLRSLKQAVSSDDRAATSKLIHYPLKALCAGHDCLITSDRQLMKNYDQIFTPTVKKAILDQNEACMSYASSGFTQENGSQMAIAIGNGEVWLDWVGKSEELKIITVNN